MKSMMRYALSLLLTAALLCPLCAPVFADTAQDAAETVDESMTILDEAALEALADQLLAAYGVEGEQREHISFAYTYLATGDSWYYNADEWFYSASMYKVPLMMVLAQKEARGELSPDSDINGITLAEAEELILVHSNNDYAHVMLNYLGGDQASRELYKQWSPLSNDYYHYDFLAYSYFTARFMNDVMNTLHNRREEFPNVTECLLKAMPGRFYHLELDPAIQVAQKYGSFTDSVGREFNSNTGIIYTPNPIALTIMSDCLSYDKAEKLMASAARLFVDYTLSVDARLASYQAELDSAEQAAQAELERIAAEEQKILEELERSEQERKAAEEQKRLAEEERKKAEQAELERLERREKLKFILIGTAGASLVVLGLVLMVSARRERRRRMEAARRRAAQRAYRERARRDVYRDGYYEDESYREYRPRH